MENYTGYAMDRCTWRNGIQIRRLGTFEDEAQSVRIPDVREIGKSL
jgi:hypothetical protein